MCTIDTCNTDVYASTIRQFLQSELPTMKSSRGDRLEVLSHILVGTLQTRLGPVPKPESMVIIREIISACISGDLPIPILVPFAPKKPGAGSIDIAELYVLKTLFSLNDRVRQHHKHGLDIRIRMEDLTGYMLEGRHLSDQMDTYCSDFEALNRILGSDQLSFIDVVRESRLMDEDQHKKEVELVRGPMLDYLSSTTGEEEIGSVAAGRELARLGWMGPIPPEMRQHYMHKYEKILPGKSKQEILKVMAVYLSNALARKRIGGSGNRRTWKRWLQINFLAPIPGSPPNTTLNYRHIPLTYCKTHVTPWRARGFLKINSNDQVTPAQVDWSEPLDLHKNVLIFREADESVHVQADYMLCG